MMSDESIEAPGTASTGKKKYVPRPRTQPLRRGKACLNCRYLKIKCDGGRPSCSACIRIPKDDPCEYNEVPSRTQELQETIEKLQARVHDLESSAASASPSNSNGQEDSIMSWGRRTHPGIPATPEPSDGGENEEPPPAMVLTLLEVFLPVCMDYGFFLHKDRFRQAALLQPPFGHNKSRPSPALLASAYLWGAHLSEAPEIRQHEPAFLRRALSLTVREVSDAIGSQIMHSIQAEVLLSYYFFRNNRFFEAEYHINGAVSMTLACGLHKIRSSRSLAPFVLGVSQNSEVYLDLPRENMEEGERINGFWTVFCLHRIFTVAMGKPLNGFGTMETPISEIDTPWPMDMNKYEDRMLFPSGTHSDSTVNRYLMDPNSTPPGPQNSIICIHYKAIIVYHRASYLAKKWTPDLSPEEISSYRNAFSALEHIIGSLSVNIPPVSIAYNHGPDSRTLARVLIITHALVTASVMVLHNVFYDTLVESTQKTILASQSILQSIRELDVPAYVNPMVGMLFMAAGTVLVTSIQRVKAERSEWMGVGPNADETSMRASLTEGMAVMDLLSLDNPFLGYQLSKIRDMYNSI